MIALAKEINSIYKSVKITVFFDKSISKTICKNEKEIKIIFDGIGGCDICPKGADPWIINRASESKFNYIISNDDFKDFFDKPAIKNKRVFQHSITENTISVLDLDIENLMYTKSEKI